MESSLTQRIQELVKELEHSMFMTTERKNQLLYEIKLLSLQLKRYRKVISEFNK